MTKPAIVFLGTPAFALPALAALCRGGYPLKGVITQPDRPQGRGQDSKAPPVKRFSLEQGLPVFQPDRVRDPAFLELFCSLAPEMAVVAAFGQILPRELLVLPRYGCLNIHPSLLPRYRGAAPIQWALIRGETRTGVTIMAMDEGMDSGDILLQEETAIGPAEDFPVLHDRLAARGADLLLAAIPQVVSGTLQRIRQDHGAATFAPLLKKEDGLIQWNRRAEDIVNLVRGLTPAPGAYTFLEGKKLRIFRAAARPGPVFLSPGQVGTGAEEGLPVAAGDGLVFLQEVQLESKKRMAAADFLRGRRLGAQARLG